MKDYKWLDKVREVCKKKDDDYGYDEPRECPECAKVEVSGFEFFHPFRNLQLKPSKGGPNYFESIGDLEEHLLNHYRMRYYLENVFLF